MCGDVATGALEGVFKVYLRCVVESWFFRVCSEGVCIAPRLNHFIVHIFDPHHHRPSM